jgi:DNA-directed RNA polymerase specialized sigma subunit
MAKNDKLDQAYVTWRTKPTPENMAMALEAADPIIRNALTSYAGGNDAFHTQAKKLAAQGFKTYDPRLGAKLHSHLMNQLQPLRRVTQRRTNVVHVPERVQSDLYHLRQAQQSYFDRFGREGADSELAEQLGVPMSRLRHLRKFMRQESSESGMQTVSDEGGSEPFYPGSVKANPEDIWMEYVHHDANPIDQKILEWKTGYNGKEIVSTQEIAKRLRISPSAVSQRAARMAKRMNELQASGA